MDRRRTLTNGAILAAFTVFCILVMEFLAVNIGQPNPLSADYTVHAVFADADGIPTAADIRVSGVVVGKVTSISHDPTSPGYSVVTLQISDTHAVPIYSNGFAKVRPKTLLGEKYVDLSVGSATTAEAISSGGYLPVAETGKDVSNDEIFNAFDAATRAQQQLVFAALDSATRSRAGDIQAIIPQLQQVVANLSPLAQVYEKDQPQSDHIFVQLNTIMQTIADEHQQLAGFLANGNIALGAIAAKDDALIATLQAASNVSTELNAAMAPTIAAQRSSLARLAPTFDSQNAFLDQILGPHCGGKPCGIDQVFTGTLNGYVAYPNDQLNVSTPTGEQVTGGWDSMFSLPSGQPNALNIVLSFHCDTVSTMLAELTGQLTPAQQAAVTAACKTATVHTTSLAVPQGSATHNESSWLAGGIFG